MEADDTIEDYEVSQSLLKRVYYAARDGMAMALFNLVSDKSPEQINHLINQTVLEEDGQQCTPLIIAARYGRDKVVKLLLDKFKPNLEQEGTVKFDGYIIEGASALWCSAGAGYLTVVKILVKAGADVNHPTRMNSTPLRAACFDGRLDIVKYLTDHNADINIANRFNNTCLMIAAFKGYLDIVTFLLERGANPNEKTHCGATALHFAAECGHTTIVSELLKSGTNITKTVDGLTPAIVAAERTRSEVVECLVKNSSITKEETIDAYELLGASYANNKDNYCLRKAYKYLHKAMELRYRDPENILQKKLGETVKAYEHWKECETLQQLESIKDNQNAIHMESLAIRERILGPNNPEVPHAIIVRGAVFADNAIFDRSIELWLHALRLKQSNNISVVKDLFRFAQVFSQMVHVGVELDFSQVLSVLEASVLELSRNQSRLSNIEPKDDVEQYIEDMESNITVWQEEMESNITLWQEEMESNIKTILYILKILTKFLVLNESRCEKQDVNKAYHLVHKLCALQLRLKDGQTLLHLAVNTEVLVNDFHINDVCKFPCAATAKLLVRCGADVNAMDNKRNTPLHVIVGYRKSISDFMTLDSIIMELIEAGAHMDMVNSNGQTPYDAVTTGFAGIILKTQTKLSLKCMAAKVVKAYNLSYSGNVPRSLESFIEWHGPGLNQG